MSHGSIGEEHQQTAAQLGAILVVIVLVEALMVLGIG